MKIDQFLNERIAVNIKSQKEFNRLADFFKEKGLFWTQYTLPAYKDYYDPENFCVTSGVVFHSLSFCTENKKASPEELEREYEKKTIRHKKEELYFAHRNFFEHENYKIINSNELVEE